LDGVARAAGFLDADLVVPLRRPVAAPTQVDELVGVLLVLTTPSGLFELDLLKGLPRIGAFGLSLLRLVAWYRQCGQDGHQGQSDHQLAQSPTAAAMT
jgi:hypothetical protein